MTKSSFVLFLFNGSRGVVRFGLAFLVLGFLLTASAQAHRVILYGWVEGGQVMTSSRFSNKRAVKGGEIAVFDEAGNLLLKGITDSGGGFSFPVPGDQPLQIVLTASPGHQAKWRISKEELVSTAKRHTHKSMSAKPTPIFGAVDTCKAEEIESIVEDVLDRKLGPVMKYIAEDRQHVVSLRDILGGIGYIFGLVGLGAYIRFRSEKRPD